MDPRVERRAFVGRPQVITGRLLAHLAVVLGLAGGPGHGGMAGEPAATLEAKPPGRATATYVARVAGAGSGEVRRQASDVLVRRLAAFEFASARCDPQGADEIVIQVPASGEAGLADRLILLPALIQRPGRLEFRCVHPDSDALVQSGRFPDGYEIAAEAARSNQAAHVRLISTQPVGPGSAEVVSARALAPPTSGGPSAQLVFSEEGSRLFSELTRTNVGRQIAILVDGELLLAPKVTEPIQGGRCEITGHFPLADVKLLAALVAHPYPTNVTVSLVSGDGAAGPAAVGAPVTPVVGEPAPVVQPTAPVAVPDGTSARVTIEAIFVELAANDTAAAGFDWLLGAGVPVAGSPPAVGGSPTNVLELRGDQFEWAGQRVANAANIRLSAALGPALTGTLTAAQKRVLLRALEQRRKVDILSAPRVTTASGQPARIQVVEVRSLVTGINPEAIVRPDIWGRTNIPTFTTAEIPSGPRVDLLPVVTADGRFVDLTVTPTLTEFLGYDPPPKDGKVRVWQNGVKKRVDLPVPRFRIRQMETRARIEDGQTLLLGAWPVPETGRPPGTSLPPGRPTRHGSTVEEFKRLFVFVTPVILNSTGRRLRTPDNPVPVPAPAPVVEPADSPRPQE